jgi:hypothetical protein
MRWIWLLGGTSAVAFVAWYVWPAPAPARHRSNASASSEFGLEGTACASNLRGLATALSLYAADHDGRLPGAAAWTASTSAYGSDAQIIHCPSVAEFGYAFHRKLSFKPIAGQPNAASTPLLFDSSKLAANANDNLDSLPSPARHADRTGTRGNLAAFVDGHAGWVGR